jgi:carbamoyl-phosphate synthase large subunit
LNILFSCIGRRGYIADYFRAHLAPNDRIIGTSNSRLTPGFRNCDLAVLLPDIVSTDYLPALTRLCRDEDITALVSFFDPDINVLSRHLGDFRALGVVPILPTPEVNEIAFDKYRTFTFALNNGFDAPETFVDLEQAMTAVETGRIRFPMVVKPRHGFASLNLFRARDANELDVLFRYVPEMMIQPLITGTEYDLDICNDLHGQVLSVVPKRKISTRAGEVDQAEICNTPSMMALGLRLGEALGKMGHVGPLDVDVIVNDDKPYILDINPRFGGGYPMSHLAGADFPRLLMQMIRKESPRSEIGQFRSGMITFKSYQIFGSDSVDDLWNVLNLRGATVALPTT